MRQLTNEIGPPGSFTYSRIYLVWEQYAYFNREVAVFFITSLVTIFIVVSVTSGNFFTSFFVLLVICLVYLNLIAMLWWWDLELNIITMLNLKLALGLPVDYSAHIAHGFNASHA